MWGNTRRGGGGGAEVRGKGYVEYAHGDNFVRKKGILTWDDVNDTGHGTHVAGMVAAVNNNGEGISSIAGGTGNGDGVRIMSCQIFDGANGVSTYEEAQAIKYADDNGAVVLQCSWGFNPGRTSFPYSPGFYTSDAWLDLCPLE